MDEGVAGGGLAADGFRPDSAAVGGDDDGRELITAGRQSSRGDGQLITHEAIECANPKLQHFDTAEEEELFVELGLVVVSRGGTKEVEPLGELVFKAEAYPCHLDEVALEDFVVVVGQLTSTSETAKFGWLGVGRGVIVFENTRVDDDITFFVSGVVFGIRIVNARYGIVAIIGAHVGHFAIELVRHLDEMVCKAV